MVGERVEHIRRGIHAACSRVGRNPDQVTLIAVTKTFDSAAVRAAVQAGVLDIGENYFQELRRKHDEVGDERIRWHFIGHLQTNKIKWIVPWVHRIHAVDSLHLGKEISRWGAQVGRPVEVLVEVNTSGESSKFGVSPDAAPSLLKELARLSSLRINGLMTMGPFLPDPEASRPAFRLLREIKEETERNGIPLTELSMGMSGDFEVAIEEGATMIRIGTSIFGERQSRT